MYTYKANLYIQKIKRTLFFCGEENSILNVLMVCLIHQTLIIREKSIFFL